MNDVIPINIGSEIISTKKQNLFHAERSLDKIYSSKKIREVKNQ